MKDKKNNWRCALIILGFVFVSGCTASAPTSNVAVSPTANLANAADSTKQSEEREHEHRAPHNGTLIVLGKEFAHIELVLNQTTGQLTAYALDGEAENAVTIAQPEIEIAVKKPGAVVVKLNAVENALTGEKLGNTSEFTGQNEELKKLNNFDGEIKSIFIKGQQFKSVFFNFPRGNENE